MKFFLSTSVDKVDLVDKVKSKGRKKEPEKEKTEQKKARKKGEMAEWSKAADC